jgi:hypothetical protein
MDLQQSHLYRKMKSLGSRFLMFPAWRFHKSQYQ